MGYSRYCAAALFAGHVARNFSLVFEFQKHPVIAFRVGSGGSGIKRVGAVRVNINSTFSSIRLTSCAFVQQEKVKEV